VDLGLGHSRGEAVKHDADGDARSSDSDLAVHYRRISLDEVEKLGGHHRDVPTATSTTACPVEGERSPHWPSPALGPSVLDHLRERNHIDEDEAMKVATEEVAAHRRERRGGR